MKTNLNDDFITRAFLEDVKAQAEKAKTAGVSAYLEKPKMRPTLRPNERFLRNTIASVQHANKRSDENEMWARRKAQLGEGRSGGSSPDTSPSPGPQQGRRASGTAALPTDHALAGDDEELERMLGQRRVRGRGGCGPRIGWVGPFLDGEELGGSEGERIARVVGPHKPERLQGKGGEGSSSGSSGSSDSDSEGRRRRRKSKEKKRKKEKRKRRKKEEKKRREKKRRRQRSPSSSPSL